MEASQNIGDEDDPWSRISKQLLSCERLQHYLGMYRLREHVYQTGGDLGIWGQIKQYWFYYKKNAAYLLALNGEVIGKQDGPVPNQASGDRELDVIASTTRGAWQ